jgi:hypothetical protein
MIIAFETDFNPSERNREVANQEKILQNILEFIYEGSYL